MEEISNICHQAVDILLNDDTELADLIDAHRGLDFMARIRVASLICTMPIEKIREIMPHIIKYKDDIIACAEGREEIIRLFF